MIIEYRAADWDREKLPFLAEELVERQVDVIVAVAEASVNAVRSASSSIPIVMPFSGDPAGSGLVTSLAHPSGNVTGLSLDVTPEIGGKMLQLLKETAPKIRTVTLWWKSRFASYPEQVRHMQASAHRLGVRLNEIKEHSLQEVEAELAAIDRHPPHALVVMADPPTSAARELIAATARKHRMPTMFSQRLYVDAGGLISYGPSLTHNFRRAAVYVAKILKGANPADLPIEQPTKFELVVNLTTAKALGITLPPGILVRADEVIP
ncbi:MAG: ABC transporter substrate-binding protein [Gammaproteobacteria bacterium]|nr:ABC transporter substrate-binding protein [Gammaproteobacteria bacterium]